MGTGAAQETRADPAAQHPDRERCMEPVHHAHVEARLDRRGLRVDRDVERSRPDAHERKCQVQGRYRMGEPRERRRDAEDGERDRDEPRTEQVGQSAGSEHRGQRGDRDAEQRQAELRLARARLTLDRRETGGPRAPVQAEHRKGRDERSGAIQSCK